MWTVDLRLRLGLTSAGTGSQALSCTGTSTAAVASMTMSLSLSEKLAAVIVGLLDGGTCFLRGVVALEDIKEEVGWDDGADSSDAPGNISGADDLLSSSSL